MSKEQRKEKRHSIAGEAGISWRDGLGQRRFCTVRGVDLSESGLRVESPEPIEVGSFIHVHAEDFGFGGTACVRHCQRRGSKHIIGLEFRRPASQSTPQDPQQEQEQFIDLYDLLQISPTAEDETIHRVYRLLASRYHPDNSLTGDLQRFLLLRNAYETLSDPPRRAAYDAEHRLRQTGPMPIFELRDFTLGIDAESNRRLGVLCLLYNRRRTNPDRPGISLLEFEQLMTIPREHLVFTVWYLKEMKMLSNEGNAEYAITAEGVRFVESSLPSNRLMQKLLRAAPDTGGAVKSPGAASGIRTPETASGGTEEVDWVS